jgi:hypothetical protein
MNTNSSVDRRLLAAVLGSVGFLAGCGAVTAEARIAAAPSASRDPQGGDTCVAIQRGCVGDIRDTRIAQAWPDRKYGDQEVAFAGTIGGSARQVLLGVDLSALPSDAKITRATVELHERTSGVAGLTMHRVLASWGEDATWSSFAGAFDLLALTTVSWSGGDDVVVFDATSLVRAWASGEAPNYGILLEQLNGTTSIATSEAPLLSDRPKVEVCFTRGS